MPYNDQNRIVFPVNEPKTLAIAERMLKQLGGANNYMYLLKLIFFADRYHIRKYLRPVTTDTYFAMRFGPVASLLYDVFRGNRKIPEIVPIGNYQVVLASESLTRKEQLSESDLEAIDFSLSNFARFGEFKTADITHAYPEWKKYGDNQKPGQNLHELMYFEDFLRNADPNDKIFKEAQITDPYPPISEDERREMESEIFEMCSQSL